MQRILQRQIYFFSKRLFVAPEVSKNDQKWSKIYFKGHYKVGMKNYSQSA